jgi:hypothetical protein
VVNLQNPGIVKTQEPRGHQTNILLLQCDEVHQKEKRSL